MGKLPAFSDKMENLKSSIRAAIDNAREKQRAEDAANLAKEYVPKLEAIGKRNKEMENLILVGLNEGKQPKEILGEIQQLAIDLTQKSLQENKGALLKTLGKLKTDAQKKDALNRISGGRFQNGAAGAGLAMKPTAGMMDQAFKMLEGASEVDLGVYSKADPEGHALFLKLSPYSQTKQLLLDMQQEYERHPEGFKRAAHELVAGCFRAAY